MALSCQVERIPERVVIKVLRPEGANNPFDERVRHRNIGNRLDFSHIQNSQIGLPAVTCEQRVIVGAQSVGWISPRDGLVEHLAHGDSINIASVHAKANDTAAPLVHDHQHPVRLA